MPSDNHATSGAHFNLPIGATFLNKYQVIQVAGSGNFARVYECLNVHTKERVAVKILKKGYERDADFECDVLRGVSRSDPHDEEGVVKLIERAEHMGLAVIVFKLKGSPLVKSRMPFADRELKEVVRDVAGGLAFLHFRVKAVHTDLKPENILAETQSGMSGRKWCICDLGSASFYKEGQLDRDLITTRPYRAPEVVLNRGWSFPSDAWSLGCILYELRTGRKLFDCHDDSTHLRLIEERLGPMPAALRPASSRSLGVSQSSTSRLVHNEFRSEPEFLSLLSGLLELDPSKRMRCDAVLSHPFLAGSSTAVPASKPLSLDTMMRTHAMVNDENAGPAKKPMTSSSAYGSHFAVPSNLLRAATSSLVSGPLASSKARKPFSLDDYSDAIQMKDSADAHRKMPATSLSAPASPNRFGSSGRSAVNMYSASYPAYSNSNPSSPRQSNSRPLISPAASTSNQNSMPLSYRLTYL